MTHLIRQQFVHVEFDGSEHEALALQRRLSSLCRENLIPAIESVLDRYAEPDRHLYLERLEVNVGTVSGDRLESEFAASVAQALEKQLREELLAAKTPPQSRTPGENMVDAFLHFLECGTLPWSLHLPVGRGLEQIMTGCLKEVATTEKHSGKIFSDAPSLLAVASVRKRLVLQFSEAFLNTLLSLFSPQVTATVAAVLGKLAGLKGPADAVKRLRQEVWEQAFLLVASGKSHPEQELVALAWRSLQEQEPGCRDLAAGVERHWAGVTGKTKGLPDENVSATASQDKGTGERDTPTGFRPDGCDNREHPEAKEGIFLDNAGLVLLHPFLPQFFRALGVATEHELLQPERALGLLHYLATGSGSAPEYQLMLPKVLCDIPLLAPVPSEFELTAEEQEEATALLCAVIRHWDVLGNSSPDGLRGTFLVRPGKLSLRGDGDWLLQVERMTCDILLEQLPWGLSMVRLPWMKRMLWVEWSW
ncbi:MAG TPA: hypothetical protein DCZ75_19120 [Geobacter sp.]|nr:hypothetical protein [Geobacter sp.]